VVSRSSKLKRGEDVAEGKRVRLKEKTSMKREEIFEEDFTEGRRLKEEDFIDERRLHPRENPTRILKSSESTSHSNKPL
jgi:hypothetical protein